MNRSFTDFLNIRPIISLSTYMIWGAEPLISALQTETNLAKSEGENSVISHHLRKAELPDFGSVLQNPLTCPVKS